MVDISKGLQNDLPLPPDNYFVVRNQSGANHSFVTLGSVRMAKSSTIVNRIEDNTPQDNFIGITIPVGITFAESGLEESPAFESSPEVFSPKDVIFVYDNETVGINKPFAASYFHHDGSQFPAGWYRTGNVGGGLQDGVVVLKPGQGYIIRKDITGNAESEIWQTLPPYLE